MDRCSQELIFSVICAGLDSRLQLATSDATLISVITTAVPVAAFNDQGLKVLNLSKDLQVRKPLPKIVPLFKSVL